MNEQGHEATVTGFDSVFEEVGEVRLPEFSGLRVMMLPVVLGDVGSLPDFVSVYQTVFVAMCGVERSERHAGSVGYLTIDEKVVPPRSSHRQAGPHVDGMFRGGPGAWGGGLSGGSRETLGNGMLTVSSPAGCRAWNQRFEGWPGPDGEVDHLMGQARDECATLLDAGGLYWVDGLCIHESVPFEEATSRRFVRLSLPSEGPWFEGYTANPLGVLPTGPILGPREQMRL